MNVKRVLVTLPMTDEQKAKLESTAPNAQFVYYPAIDIRATFNPELTEDEVQKADVILGDVPSGMLKQSPRLKFLQLDSAGVNGYISGVLHKDTYLCNATGSYGLAISETMLGMALMLKKRLHQYYKQQEKHLWECLGPVTAIDGAVVLCVGLGDIGGEFAKRCKLLGAYTIGVRRARTEKPEWLDELHLIQDIDDLIPRADIIAMVLPDTPKTRNLFNRERLSKVKSDAIIINAGRGTVLDQDALCEMLNEGKLAGAGLDVTNPEPLPKDHPLWDAPNTIITPHVTGGYTLQRTLDKIIDLATENLRRFIAGEKLINLVDFEEGYASKA